MQENKTVETDPKELMRLAKEGDSDAFAKIYMLYFVPVFRYIHVRIKNKQLVEDLTQTVFLKVYQSIPRFEEQNRSPLCYFFTVARNTVIDHARKKKDVLIGDWEKEMLPASQVAEGPEKIVQKNETIATVQQAIKELTEDQREVIILKFIDELPNQEIALLLGKTEEAVRQLQCRALKALRERCNKEKMT